MGVIERCIKSRNERQSFGNLLKQAREMFMSEDALDMGAEDNEYYTNAALMVRAGLREDPLVVEALRYAWNRIRLSERNLLLETREYEFGPEKPPRDGEPEFTLTKVAYGTLIRKLYIALKLREKSDAKINPVECLHSMKDDWAKDSCGQKTMSEMAFNKCMFELTDLWVEGVDASDYADFLTAIADAITAWRNPGGGDEGRWMGWRFDEETLDNLTLLVKLPRELERRSSFSNSPGASSPVGIRASSPLELVTNVAYAITELDKRKAEDFERKRWWKASRFQSRRRGWMMAFVVDETRITGEFRSAESPSSSRPPRSPSPPPQEEPVWMQSSPLQPQPLSPKRTPSPSLPKRAPSPARASPPPSSSPKTTRPPSAKLQQRPRPKSASPPEPLGPPPLVVRPDGGPWRLATDHPSTPPLLVLRPSSTGSPPRTTEQPPPPAHRRRPSIADEPQRPQRKQRWTTSEYIPDSRAASSPRSEKLPWRQSPSLSASSASLGQHTPTKKWPPTIERRSALDRPQAMGLYHSVSSPQIEGLRRPHTMAAPQHRAAPRMEELWPWQRDTSSASLLAVLDKAAASTRRRPAPRRPATASAAPQKRAFVQVHTGMQRVHAFTIRTG